MRDSPKPWPESPILSDPLSDILDLVHAKSVVSVGLVTGGDWSIHTPGFEGLKFNAVVRGQAWLALEGDPDKIHLREGDCFILTHGGPFVMASDLALRPVEAATAFAGASPRTNIARYGEHEDFLVIGGKMTMDAADAPLLVDALPSVIHLPANSPGAETVRWLLKRLIAEFASPAPGAAMAAALLLQLMFVEGLRAQLSSGDPGATDWAGALGDTRIADAVHALHADPARAWTLPMLADVAGMSRSNFALRFKALVGVPPLDYLQRWRMRLARRSLRTGTATVASIGQGLGYESDSAFSGAFKRVSGLSPSQYRQRSADGS